VSTIGGFTVVLIGGGKSTWWHHLHCSGEDYDITLYSGWV